MATIKQKLAFKEIVVNGSTIKGAMQKAGYAESTANRTNKLTRTNGFNELCDTIGLTDEFITQALYEDIKNKPKKRHKELELAFKVKGKLAGDNGGGNTTNIFNIIAGEQIKRIAARVLDGSSTGESEPHRLPDSDEPKV